LTYKPIEERRVQRLGTSSLIVTLPKKWVKRIGLKPGDTVVIISKDDYIIVKPKSSEAKISTMELSVDEMFPENTLLNIIKCLYFNNYRKIMIDLSQLKATTIKRLILALRELPGTEHEIINNKIIIYIKNKEEQERLIKSLLRLTENLTLILSSVEEYLDKGVNKELVIDSKKLLEESLKAYNDIKRVILQDNFILNQNNKVLERLLYGLISQDLWNLTKIASRTIETLHNMKPDLPQEEAAAVINSIVQVLFEVRRILSGSSRVESIIFLLDKVREYNEKLLRKSPYIYSKAETFTELLSNIVGYLQCLEAIRFI